MKTKKLLKALDKLFDKERRKLHKHYTELNKLLKELHRKKKRLARKIEAQSDEHQREQFERKLAVIDAQIEKGAAALERLEVELEQT